MDRCGQDSDQNWDQIENRRHDAEGCKEIRNEILCDDDHVFDMIDDSCTSPHAITARSSL